MHSAPTLAAFLSAYDEVLTRVEPPPGDWTGEEKDWFEFWRVRSVEECHAWPDRPWLREYMALAERSRLRAAGIVAYAFLHLSYDLPRFWPIPCSRSRICRSRRARSAAGTGATSSTSRC